MSLTAKVMPYKQGMGPFAPEIYRLPFAYPYRWKSEGADPETVTREALAYAVDTMHKHIGEENIAAVIMEPIQGEGGFIVPSPGFVAGIAEFCAAHGIVFIADEIQSAMGRAGRWYAIEDEGVVPDLVTTAKSMGGGLPISAVTGRAEIMDAVHAGGLGGTYGGNPVAAAASLAVLDKIEREDLLARSREVGATIMERFTAMAERYDAIGDIRGRGAMLAIELVTDRGTKEPLRRRGDERDRRRLPRPGRDRADGRDLRQRGPPPATDQHRGRAARGRPAGARRRGGCRRRRNRHIAERLLPFRP